MAGITAGDDSIHAALAATWPLFLATSVALALGLVMIGLKDLVLNHLH